MPYSHHSHSGQFCGHAKNTLEEVVQTAIAKGFHTFAMTEHIPRPFEDFYPGEADEHTEETLTKLFQDYITEAYRLRDVYSDKIQLFVGFESEYIRPSTLRLVQGILARNTFDFFVGSIHHMYTIPIDLDQTTYDQAREKAGGSEEKLFEDYFDLQYEMLQALRPPIVGHFDLIRLLSDHRDDSFKDMVGVWERIQRNLKFIASYGGLLELNSAGLRKGLAEPYPCLPICQMFLATKGGFVMSDDSHGTDQVGTNYAHLLAFIQRTGMERIHFANRDNITKDDGFPKAKGGFSHILVKDLALLPFWASQ